MYISKLNIKNFRNFRNSEILFNDGINVIIGHNNAGKTNLLKALSLVINYQGAKRLDIDDFNKYIPLEELQANPPKIKIELTISESVDEDLNSDDLVTVGNWLTKLDSPYEAMLTYEFFLPERIFESYNESISTATTTTEVWKIINREFIRYYSYKLFCGNSINQTSADGESLEKFDFQYLEAIRDVERDMLTGKNTLLRDVFHFFMDYDIKSDDVKDKETKKDEIKNKTQAFSDKADDLLIDLQSRMEEGKKHILSYAQETGASFNKAIPDFEGSISDIEMFSALRLIVKYETGIDIKIPATHNGLGYNNLIYMSLLLAKMQVNSDGTYLDSNAKVFPILAIEEPEAHLHPAMQYKFLKFLRENKESRKKVRQIFVTTHSTQITSAVSLDEIICLHEESGELNVGYPSKCFSDDADGRKSKAYVQRFLDATKSEMLFAQKVILVEGISEQLLLSVMAKYLSKSLEDNHVAVINVGGRFFDYFLSLFDTNNNNTIPKRIACLTDRDPVRKLKTKKDFLKCYPFEFNLDNVTFDYKENASESIAKFEIHPNIRFFSQDKAKGKTLEYDLMFYNPTLKLLLTDSTANKPEIEALIDLFLANENVNEFTDRLRDSSLNQRIAASVLSSDWSDDDKRKSIIATRYLNSVGKGGNALELSYVLEENLRQETPETFNVPDYIKDAIEWICQ
jgi:putative ATP-dependent endonuclease of the OLD family